jgi:hypothetical protein
MAKFAGKSQHDGLMDQEPRESMVDDEVLLVSLELGIE